MNRIGQYFCGALAIFSLCHGELVQNGSFEEGGANEFPAHWHFSTKRSERADVFVTAAVREMPDAPDGKRAVEFHNPADGVNDVYGSIFQDIKVEPGKHYRLTFYLKGQNVNQFQLIMGKHWGVRWVVPTGGLKPDKWKFFSHEFIAKGDHVGEDGAWMLRFNIEGLTDFGAIDRISVVPLEDGPVAGTSDGSEADAVAELDAARAAFAGYEKRYRELHRRLSTAREGYATSPYLAIYTEMLPRQFAMLRRDLHREYGSTAERDYYLGIARIALPELQELLAEMTQLCDDAEDGWNPPESWRLLPGKMELKNGFQYAPMRNSAGVTEVRPVMFGGFGHFRQVIDDIPLLSQIGANVIQIEVGPDVFFPKEGRNKEFEPDFTCFEEKIEPAFQRAYENGMRIAFLTSTHYVPGWFRKKYPETVVPHLFMPLELLEPKAREMQQAFLEALCEKIAKSPWRGALQSIVLSNEPTYGQCRLDREFSRAEFKKYLVKNYGDVSAFNRIAGSGYADFDALIAAARREDAPAKREFNVFKQRAFADWHRFLAEIIRRRLPEVPLHAKLMIMHTFAARELGCGYDPELFAEFCDLSGNDNGNSFWMDPAIGTELQYSFRQLAVNNTENHYIPDGYANAFPSDAIYAAVFQQYLYGANNLVGWVWADNPFNNAPWLDGAIMRRPANVAAHQRAVLDANRLAPEIVGFIQAEPTIAILYSPTSLILNRAPYCERLFDIYRTLAPLGYKIGFISEKQLAAKEFRKVKLLIAGEVKNLRADAAAGIDEFVRRGGRVLALGESFHADEFNRPLARKIGRSITLKELPAAVRENAPPLPFAMTQMTPEDAAFPVQARSAELPDGRILLNLINHGRKTQTVKLNCPARDLITGKHHAGTIELPYKRPFLLELE